jgi:hypothetical protein
MLATSGPCRPSCTASTAIERASWQIAFSGFHPIGCTRRDRAAPACDYYCDYFVAWRWKKTVLAGNFVGLHRDDLRYKTAERAGGTRRGIYVGRVRWPTQW